MCNMKTGSPLLFEGKNFISFLIRFGGWIGGSGRSKITHIEMALWAPDFSPLFRSDFNMMDDEFYSLKSTSMSKVKDVFGDFVDGVSITRLQSVIDAEKGRVWTRGLNKSPSNKDIRALEMLVREIYRRPYEKDTFTELAAAALDRTGYRAGEDHSSLFCSEIFTWIYNIWDYLKQTDNETTPADYEGEVELKRGRKFYALMPVEEALC